MYKLAIAIPTYNRPNELGDNLNNILSVLIKEKIKVYISDDSLNDETKDLVAKLRLKYDNFNYIKNSPSLGHDLNCIQTLSLSKNDEYIWYMNDSALVSPESIERVVEMLNFDEELACLIVNTAGRVQHLSDFKSNDKNKFFNDLAWHTTLTGVTIYNARLLKAVLDSTLYQKYIGSNFIQTGILVEVLMLSNLNYRWYANSCFVNHPSRTESYWQNNVFQVFGYDWVNFVNSLPYLTAVQRLKLIKQHGENTGLFSYQRLISFRCYGALSLRKFFKYYSVIKQISDISLCYYFFVSVLPKSLCCVMRYFGSIIKKKINND